MNDKIRGLLWNTISSGLPAAYELEVLRKIFLLNLIIIVGGFFLAVLSSIAYIQQEYLLGIVDLIVFLFLILLFAYLRKTKNYDLIGMIGTIVAGAFYFFLIAYGGIAKTAYVWAFTYPLISLFLLGIKRGTFMSLFLLGMASTVFAVGSKVSFFTSYSIDLVLRFIPAYLTIHLFAFVMEKVREKVQSRLKTSNMELEKANKEKEKLIHELKKTMNEVKTLRGILPICTNCKKIRDDDGYWEQVEKYIQNRSEAQFSHSLCPECAKKLYPDFLK